MYGELILLTLTDQFTNNIIEILLSLVLVFNIGAYKILWARTENLQERARDLEEWVAQIRHRVFGSEFDETDEGHIKETEEEIDKLYDKLEKNAEERKREHEEVRRILRHLVVVLSDEEEVDIDYKSFDF